ncbi:hypothetical protein [Salinivirga cyanobacteriivorans]|nr:hypothetical protein [Salinivirga cyanobacteriivorans]
MKKIFFVWITLLINIVSFSQENNVDGVLNSTSVTPAFEKGHEAIKASIKESLFNLNLYEYAHALNELYELMHSNEVSEQGWNNYIDTLQYKVKKEWQDTVSPFYATDYKGIIPLQAKFFIGSLNKNKNLKEKYPNEYNFLKNSTSELIGKGYSWTELDSLLVLFPRNSTTGTVNFWYFLQVKGCPVINLAIEKVGVDKTKMLLGNLDITSTYKSPLYLQVRKYNSLKQKLKKCSFEAIEEIRIDGTILDRDKDKTYFKDALKEGFDMDKKKEF